MHRSPVHESVHGPRTLAHLASDQRPTEAVGLGVVEPALAARRRLLDSGLSESVRNNDANELRRLHNLHLISDLTRMLWDENETPKWRNYCVQQLTQCYLEEPEERILDTILKAAESPVPMVRSCAVWSLALIATDGFPGPEAVEKAKQVALAALREEDAHVLIRTGGVQASARLGLGEALPDIRRLAGSEETRPASLRVAAVAAVLLLVVGLLATLRLAPRGRAACAGGGRP